jgi:hypothetical protein
VRRKPASRWRLTCDQAPSDKKRVAANLPWRVSERHRALEVASVEGLSDPPSAVTMRSDPLPTLVVAVRCARQETEVFRELLAAA